MTGSSAEVRPSVGRLQRMAGSSPSRFDPCGPDAWRTLSPSQLVAPVGADALPAEAARTWRCQRLIVGYRLDTRMSSAAPRSDTRDANACVEVYCAIHKPPFHPR